MQKIKIEKNNKLLDNAKSLRKNMTPHEKHLWYDFLNKYPVKIYRQRIIDDFIVDFYCAKARLVVEIDQNFNGVCSIIDKIINVRIDEKTMFERNHK